MKPKSVLYPTLFALLILAVMVNFIKVFARQIDSTLAAVELLLLLVVFGGFAVAGVWDAVEAYRDNEWFRERNAKLRMPSRKIKNNPV